MTASAKSRFALAMTCVLFCAVNVKLAAADLVVNGNFDSGNTGFTSGYTYTASPPPQAEGFYSIGTSPPPAYGDWQPFGDHTSGTGNMLVANGALVAGTSVWSETVAVLQNTDYTFSFWGATVDTVSGSESVLQSVINSSDVGSALTLPETSPANGGSWTPSSVIWNSGSSTQAILSIVDTNINAGYNDFALDDISLTPTASVPEPSSLILLGLGVLGLLGCGMRHCRLRARA